MVARSLCLDSHHISRQELKFHWKLICSVIIIAATRHMARLANVKQSFTRAMGWSKLDNTTLIAKWQAPPAYDTMQQVLQHASATEPLFSSSSTFTQSKAWPLSLRLLHSRTFFQTKSGRGRPTDPCKFDLDGWQAHLTAGCLPIKNIKAGCTAPRG